MIDIEKKLKTIFLCKATNAIANYFKAVNFIVNFDFHLLVSRTPPPQSLLRFKNEQFPNKSITNNYISVLIYSTFHIANQFKRSPNSRRFLCFSCCMAKTDSFCHFHLIRDARIISQTLICIKSYWKQTPLPPSSYIYTLFGLLDASSSSSCKQFIYNHSPESDLCVCEKMRLKTRLLERKFRWATRGKSFLSISRASAHQQPNALSIYNHDTLKGQNRKL